ncbi:MAG TPA: sulfur carrier protein ThiS [Dehalococcoidia bacterium]|jgi:thiamine biosynthesis protein ThiS|nr:thiamine biosynthesis protein ThiS [Chloroflexota bacterium]MDP6055590.1 sulfur carrier protein ThiS [Dehalococcoidia bacterium]MDP7091101.1 sulfur carrier protein ThiS [Dehalococcoidia bacterium]MDP7261333.1 sulfur carrier protein ThiS [Dehalococcoidia bacterium]MDP7484446.1 sulfur carrier protein ThiS [Dehalococcoidia bacterium]|tara:strand:- start:5584 stop:5790 length:207 start_codon:yes stop_codon:yes gene_type:complete
MIEITVNGQNSELEDPLSIDAFLELKRFTGRSVAVAINSVVIRRSTLEETLINEDDMVEIVRLFGGGL